MTREQELELEVIRLNKIIDALVSKNETVVYTTTTTNDYIGGRPNDRG